MAHLSRGSHPPDQPRRIGPGREALAIARQDLGDSPGAKKGPILNLSKFIVPLWMLASLQQKESRLSGPVSTVPG